MLKIENVSVSSNGILILENINLEATPGEIHAIIGPKRCGKSTLGNIIAGHPRYRADSGKITFKRKNIFNLNSEERNNLGIFLSFQNPPDILGISNSSLIVEMSKTKRNSKSKTDILQSYKNLIKQFELGSEWKDKDFNLGSTPSERKKNEIAQMISSNPELILIDDLEDGVDEDTVKFISNEIQNFLKNNDKIVLIFTSSTKILDSLSPTKVHLMSNGKIVKTGDKKILKRIRTNGY
jgi:Fe-S cluster assembly ATP-binding protein